jgi:hypothetical protein
MRNNAIPTAEQKESGQQKEIVNGVLVPKKYMVLNIPVNINGSKKIFTPDKNSGLRFQKAWGKDYSKWVNKKFQVKKETYKAFGTDKLRVAGFPIDK